MIHLYQDTPIGGGDALYAMTDVNINNPEDGQMLVYDASTQRWRNVTQKSLNDLAEVTDLTNIIATGTTNATGSTIPKGWYFYLNDDLCQAKADIANGATFTLNTNYEEVTAGGLNALNSKITITTSGNVGDKISYIKFGNVVHVSFYGLTSSDVVTSLPAPYRGQYTKIVCDYNGTTVGYVQYTQGVWTNNMQAGKTGYSSACYICAD